MSARSFRPLANLTISATTSATRVEIGQVRSVDLSGNGLSVNRQRSLGDKVVIQPVGDDVFIKFGDSTVAATSTDVRVRDGAIMEYGFSSDRDTHISVLAATGAAQVYATIGS